MKNRDSAHPGRIKLTPVDEANGIYDLTRADEPRDEGTPLNKKLLDYAVAACGVTAGTATAYTLDDEFGGFELVDGAKVNFRLHVASGANPTLNVNGTGAKAIVNVYGDALPEGTAAEMWLTATYSSMADVFVTDVKRGLGVSAEQITKWDNSMRVLYRQATTGNAALIRIPISANCKYLHLHVNQIETTNNLLTVKFGASVDTTYTTLYKSARIYMSNALNSFSSTYRRDGEIMSNDKVDRFGSFDMCLSFTGNEIGCSARLHSTTAEREMIRECNGRIYNTDPNNRYIDVYTNSGHFINGTKITVEGVIEE